MMTGDEYRASLNDGRETYFEGRRIDNVAEDPLLGITVNSAAAGYDRFYDPAPGAIGAFLKVPSSAAELREQVELHETVDLLTHVTYASIMTLLTAADRIEATLPENAARIRTWVDEAQKRDVRITQCITDAKGDRSRRPGNQDDPDQFVRVVERREDGIVIRGAKLHISAASMGHELMTIPTKSMKPGEDDYSVACMVPVNAPGVKIINTTYAPRHEDTRDFPISSRQHTPEGFVIFDDVFVPSERVFLDGHPELAGLFAHSLGLWERLGGLSSMASRVRCAGRFRATDFRSERARSHRPHQGEDLRDADQCDADSRQPRRPLSRTVRSPRTVLRSRMSCTPTRVNTMAPPTGR